MGSIGSSELDLLVQNDPRIAPRVEVRVSLQPLGMENSTAYIAHRLGVVGGQMEVFPPATLEVLYKLGRGRPRLLNTLADNALFEAYLAGRTTIDASDVERAAGDLGIGPDPGATFTTPTPVAPAEDGLPLAAPPAPDARVEAVGLPDIDEIAELKLSSLGPAPGGTDLELIDTDLELIDADLELIDAEPEVLDAEPEVLEAAELSAVDVEELASVFVELVEE